jgi:hypothetical protein
MQLAGGDGTFLAAAQQGMFAVDTASAGQMMMSIRQMQETLNIQLARIRELTIQTELGDLPGMSRRCSSCCSASPTA